MFQRGNKLGVKVQNVNSSFFTKTVFVDRYEILCKYPQKSVLFVSFSHSGNINVPIILIILETSQLAGEKHNASFKIAFSNISYCIKVCTH